MCSALRRPTPPCRPASVARRLTRVASALQLPNIERAIRDLQEEWFGDGDDDDDGGAGDGGGGAGADAGAAADAAADADAVADADAAADADVAAHAGAGEAPDADAGASEAPDAAKGSSVPAAQAPPPLGFNWGWGES